MSEEKCNQSALIEPLGTHNGWTFERIDDLEIRVTAPDGEAWRSLYALESDPFNYFLWRMAQGMLGG